MTLGGLFSGIGGFELAAQWAGITPVWSNDIDPFCCEVLRKNFTHDIICRDIKTITGNDLQRVDIIAGGFPCQPFSKAGKKGGKNDSRYLWPDMLRIIKEIGPKVVFVENVFGIIKMVLHEVLDDLEAQGYWTETFVIPAYAVGGFHNRNRVWIVALKADSFDPYSNRFRSYQAQEHFKRGVKLSNEQISLPGPLVSECVRKGTDTRVFRNIDGIPNRVDRIKAVGNAVVPQIAYEFFKSINSLFD